MDHVERNQENKQPDDSSPADTSSDLEKRITKTKLINRLNFINFQNGNVLINFKHRKYNRIITKTACPQPCRGDFLVCLWQNPDELEDLFDTYQFQDLVVTNGLKIISVKAVPRQISRKGICLPLPEASAEINVRKTKRHICDGLNVTLMQNGVSYSGRLLDFNAVSLKLLLSSEPPQTFQWINLKAKVNIIITNQKGPLYTAECRIIRQSVDGNQGAFILEPLNQVIQRYKPKEYRSRRFTLSPSPNLIFLHPFTHKTVSMKVLDLSGSGFSVEDDRKNSILPAGMILPELELNFANSFTIKGKAQVVYRKNIILEGKKAEAVKCGLALLDMGFEDHLKLLAVLHQVENRNAYICNKVDLDDLWRFFFETGFLYPKKYIFLQQEKEKIKAVYQKLYTGNPSIARHFIYQENGAIRGHMAMLRFYNKTWLIHHHAARSTSLLRAGLVVLDQVGQYTYESHRLYSSHMDYLMCYYRPNNSFPEHVFGGAARHINNPDGCSLDLFTYSHIRKPVRNRKQLPSPWKLVDTEQEDLLELESYYQAISGGLMVRGLDLSHGIKPNPDLSTAYQAAGLKRERKLFSVKAGNQLKAVAIVSIADVALNLSDLTSCIKVIVIDPQDLPKDILESVVARLADLFEQSRIPLLLFPASYADDQTIPYEKQYNLWLLNTDYSDDYFKFIDELNKLRNTQS